MNRFLMLSCIILGGLYLQAQTGFPRYYEYAGYVNRADSLYKAGQFAESAALYGQAAGVRVEKGIPVPYADIRYNAACAWALAGQADSAFYQLNASANLGFSDTGSLLADKDLVVLHGDRRWQQYTDRVMAAAARKERLAGIYEERTRFAADPGETVFLPLKDNVKALIQSDSLPFLSMNHENFRLYFKGNSYAAGHLADLKVQVSAAFRNDLNVLDTTGYDIGINLVLVDSRDELREVTGIAAYGGMALVGDNTLFLVFNGQRRLQAKHELFHLMSNDLWGPTGSRLLDEGGAVYADNECYGPDPLYGISAWLKKTGRVLPFQSLIGDFDGEARKSDVIAYLESAAIFKYLYETYGIPKLKRLRSEGFGSFEMIYGFPFSRLESEWNALISGTRIPDGIDWEKLLKEGCG